MRANVTYEKDSETILVKKRHVKRPAIYFLLNTWKGYIYFYYTEVDPNAVDLKELEQKLLDTFTPPFSERGYSAVIGAIKKITEK